MYRTAAVLVLVLATSGPLAAQTEPTVTIRVEVWWDAFTVCVGDRLVTYTAHDVASVDAGALAAHEAHHRRRVRAFGSCEAFQRWWRASEANQRQEEAMAYCESAKHDAGTGRFASLVDAANAYGRTLQRYFEWTTAEATAAILRACVGR